MILIKYIVTLLTANFELYCVPFLYLLSTITRVFIINSSTYTKLLFIMLKLLKTIQIVAKYLILK